MSLQIRRGLEVDRGAITFDEGEIFYVTDTNLVYVGDGITPGGILVSGAGGGFVVGPASAVNNNIALFDGITGELIKDSLAAISIDGTFASNSDAKIPTEKAVKAYADALVVGLWDDRGNFDASVNAYPSSGGSGTAGAILKGDIWTVSVAGTLPTGLSVAAGDTVRALIDTPGNTQANWAIAENNIGYVPENVSNKSTDVNTDQASNTKYPSVKAVYDWAVGLFQTLANKDATGGYAGLTLFKINFKNAANTFTSFFTNANTASRTYTFPDQDGTVALTGDDYFVLTCLSTTISPADSTSYYFDLAAVVTGTTDTNVDFNLGIPFTIVGFVMACGNNTIQGSAEDATAQIRNTTTATSHLIGTFKTNSTSSVAVSTTFTGLNIAVGASDDICIQVDTPAWAVNPVSLVMRAYVICKR